MSLIIFCLESQEVGVVQTIDRHAALGWKTSGDIIVCAMPEDSKLKQNRTSATGYAKEKISTVNPLHVIVINGPQIQKNLLERSGLFITTATVKGFEQDRRYEDAIASTGWSWRQRVQDIASHWSHSVVDVPGWLKQFNDLGGLEWVGVNLLKLLHFWPEATLSSAICDALPIARDQRVKFGVFSIKAGKSGGVVANLLRKRFTNATITDVTDCIEQSGPDDTVVLVEDGLYTATEIIGVFDSLLGNRPADRAPKARALDDVGKLKSCRLTVAFGVTVDYGQQILQQYLIRKSDVVCATLLTPQASTLIKVLASPVSSDETVTDMESRQYREKIRNSVIPWIFQHEEVWGDRLADAKECLKQIGTQLWSAYVARMVEGQGWKHEHWPTNRVELCSLGMDGLGLTVVLAHSVPKATLPMFWTGGRITVGKKELDWKPLFGNA